MEGKAQQPRRCDGEVNDASGISNENGPPAAPAGESRKKAEKPLRWLMSIVFPEEYVEAKRASAKRKNAAKSAKPQTEKVVVIDEKGGAKKKNRKRNSSQKKKSENVDKDTSEPASVHKTDEFQSLAVQEICEKAESELGKNEEDFFVVGTKEMFEKVLARIVAERVELTTIIVWQNDQWIDVVIDPEIKFAYFPNTLENKYRSVLLRNLTNCSSFSNMNPLDEENENHNTSQDQSEDESDDEEERKLLFLLEQCYRNVMHASACSVNSMFDLDKYEMCLARSEEQIVIQIKKALEKNVPTSFILPEGERLKIHTCKRIAFYTNSEMKPLPPKYESLLEGFFICCTTPLYQGDEDGLIGLMNACTISAAERVKNEGATRTRQSGKRPIPKRKTKKRAH